MSTEPAAAFTGAFPSVNTATLGCIEGEIMGLFDFVKSGVQEMMIARPDALKHLVVYKHPNQNVPMFSQLTVDSDEAAVFFKDGKVVGVLPPGRHTLQTQNIPFLNSLITSATGGNVLIAEIFFVKTAPIRSIPFGGPIGDMIDPLTGEQVCPRIFGEFSLAVTDPVRFVIGYAGQGATGDNDFVLDWIKGLFLQGVKTVLGELCEVEQKSVLQCVALTTKLAQAFVQRCPDLNDCGVRVLQMGRFDLNFNDDDRGRLVAANAEIAKANRGVKVAQAAAAARQFELDQKFQQDARYVKDLAGNFQNYAAGQAMIGAGQGMAAHGVGDGGMAGAGAQMAVGMGMGQMMQNAYAAPPPQFGAPGYPQGAPQAQAAPPPAAVSPGGLLVACGACGAKQGAGKFCAECGTPLAQPKKFCVGCGGELAPGAKFCANCGTSAAAPPQSGG